MGVKHHYQQHQLGNITASQFKRWKKREYSNQLQTDTLYHMMYTVQFYIQLKGHTSYQAIYQMY
jgi:hypothetical protein